MSENDFEFQPSVDPDEVDHHSYEGHDCLGAGDGFGAIEHFTWLVETWTSIDGFHGVRTMVERSFLARAKAVAGFVDEAIADQKQLVLDRTAVFGPADDATLSMRGQLAQTYPH